MVNKNQRRRDILAGIEALVVELQQLDLPDASPTIPRAPSTAIVAGSRVRVLNGNGWHHCPGTVHSRRGRLHWNVLMDLRPGDAHRVTLFRMDKNLELIAHPA
jgi:hypothetical protein